MSADIGAAGSSHASQFSDPALPGADEATVIRPPTASSIPLSPGDSQPAFINTPTVRPTSSPSPTLKRLFDTDESIFGLKLGDFVLEERIGTGGMGAVFKAHDTRLSRKIALKVLSPKACSDSKLIDRFHNEARAAARLSHDNIARVYSSGEDLGVHFIAYELIAGTNLRDLIQKQETIRTADALNYSIQIAMALNHTAAEGVVHRDIKPSNIIITPDGRARVVDLGLARRDGEDSIADLTVAGSTLGTFDYISPEQAQDPRKVDIRSDIYSLGCTMFHMLTGQPPYPEGTALQKLLDHKGKDAPSPIQVNRKVPRDLSAVVHRMMASDPNERHATPAELVESLLGIASRLGLRGIQPEGLVWLRSSETRPPFLQANLGWIAMAGLLLLAVVALRLQPHSLDTDSDWATRRAKETAATDAPTGTDPDADTEIPGTQKASAFAPLGDAIAGLSESSLAESGREMAGSFSDLMSQFTDMLAKRSETPVVPDTGSMNTGVDSVSNATPATGSSPLITLESDPENPFTTLEAACWKARDGDVVIIRPDRDNTPLVEKPLRIVNKNITIRGVNVGGRVPLIRFDVGAEPTDNEGHMITLVGGQANIANVDFQVITRDDVGAENWVLCAFAGADRVRFDRVNVDIPNPQGLPCSVFEVTLGDAAAEARMEEEGGDYEIQLSNCFVRGNCELFHIDTPLPGSLEVNDSAIGITRPLLFVAGTNDTLQERDRVELELSHTTGMLAQGLLNMSNIDDLGGPTRELVPVEIFAENNIFATATTEPMVLMEGTLAEVEFRSLLTWNGQKNLYHGFNVFWEIDSSLAGLEVLQDTFENWKNIWSDAVDAGEVGAKESDPWLSDRWEGRELTEVRLSDMQLDDTDSLGDAIGTATDGSNLGASLVELRRFLQQRFVTPE